MGASLIAARHFVLELLQLAHQARLCLLARRDLLCQLCLFLRRPVLGFEDLISRDSVCSHAVTFFASSAFSLDGLLWGLRFEDLEFDGRDSVCSHAVIFFASSAFSFDDLVWMEFGV